VQTSRPARVFLVGMMGCGKSAVGTALARRLGWRYRDNDHELLHVTAGDAVDAVAAELGRERLHELEAEQAALAAREPSPLVAGLAASVVERVELWPVLRAAGWCVYLRATVETLAARVGTGEGRPWLASDQVGFIKRTLAQRHPLYMALADLVVDVDTLDPDQIAESIIGRLKLEVAGGN
jgi:shikimate kinase